MFSLRCESSHACLNSLNNSVNVTLVPVFNLNRVEDVMKCNPGRSGRQFAYMSIGIGVYLLLSGFIQVNVGNNSVHTGVVIINGRRVESTAPSPVVSDVRKIGNFSSVEITGSFNAEIRCGAGSGLVISAEKRLLPRIVTRVEGRTLRIFTRGDISTSAPLRLEITTPELFELKADGASDITMSCTTSHLSVSLQESVNVVASGSVSELSVTLNGASGFDAAGFKASDVFLEARDSSSAILNVSNRLDAAAYGASEVRYYGSPGTVNAKVNDAADIEAAE